jgi:hypothetical protein
MWYVVLLILPLCVFAIVFYLFFIHPNNTMYFPSLHRQYRRRRRRRRRYHHGL